MWGAGVVFSLIGLLAERSSGPNEVAGGDGLFFYAVGGLAIIAGLCWSVGAAVVAIVKLARSREGRSVARTALAVNAVPLCGTATLIGLTWLTNTS